MTRFPQSPQAEHDATHDALCVPIQWGSANDSPVFCVPGAGANASCFVPLAGALGNKTPVYGLQPRGLDGIEPPFRDVEEAVQSYLRPIRRIAKHGLCKLIGHSFGGWIAFELARQLERAGDIAVSLTIVDSEAPCEDGATRAERRGVDALVKLVTILEQASERPMQLSRDDFARVDEAARVPLLARAMVSVGLLSPRTPVAAVNAMVRVFEANLNTRYQPESPLRLPATLVLPRVNEAESDDPVCSIAAWRGFLPHLAVAEMPGNHMTMLAHPHVARLAQIVHQPMPSWKASESRRT